MKHLISIFALCLLHLAAAAQPRITWLSSEHDFGAFSEDVGKVTTTFRYVNSGDQPLVITNARANCGCTTPNYNTSALAPGDTAEIHVQFDAVGRPGRFSKKIFIDTNTSPERSTLVIHGVVVGSRQTVATRYPVQMGKLALLRGTALLGDVNKAHLKVEMLSAYNASTDSLTPAVTDLPRWLTVSCTPSPVAPGEQMSFNFMVHPDRTDIYGQIADTVTIIPDSQQPDVRFRLPVVATINEDFSQLTDKQIAQSPQATLLQERVDLGIVPRNTPLTATYQLRNDGKTPLLIRRLTCSAPTAAVKISTDKIKPGKTATITLTYTPAETTENSAASTASASAADSASASAAFIYLKITLITNDPLNPTQTLRFTAEPR